MIVQLSLLTRLFANINPSVAVATVGGLLIIYLVFYLFYSNEKDAPPRFPFLWDALSGKFNMKDGPLDLIRAGYKAKGDIFRIKLFRQGVTFVVGPKAHQLFYDATDYELSQREVYKFTIPVFGKGIVYDAPPQRTIQQLSFVRTGLNNKSMTSYVPKIVRETEQFFASWGKEGEVDLFEKLSELTILTASRCLLGDEIRENLHSKFAHLYHNLNLGMTMLSVVWPYAPTAAHKNRDESRRQIVEIFAKVINERRAAQEKNPNMEKPLDFLQVLIDSRYKDEPGMSNVPTVDEISGLLLAALFGGQHTSSITSTWMGLNIMANPHLIPRMLEEQKQVLGESKELTLDALNKMDLLHAVCKETLRMYPPLILLLRYVLKGDYYKYKGFTVPEGDIMVSAVPVAHEIEEIYKDPKKFDPDRFLAPRNEGSTAELHEFISFGGGRHACLGRNFGFLQIKTIWSVLLRNFEFERLGSGFRIDYTSMVAGPGTDTRVRYKRRPVPL